ncbi:MAG: hypothetical protein IT376_21100 [Polyangiaceae bacterium]|nr:hypothetical protein [Polyangiaceae bacterium]
MKRGAVGRRPVAVWLLLAALGWGCSADDPARPAEPSLATPGSYIALREADEALRLYRLRDRGLFGGTYLLLTDQYAERAGSVAEARSIAVGGELSVVDVGLVVPEEYFTAREHHVVWWRSLAPGDGFR